MCSIDVDHLLHVFFDCRFASQCWQHAGLAFSMWEVEDASTWLLNTLDSADNDHLVKVGMTLWAIWFFRNKKVWENKVVSPQFVVEWSCNHLREWKSVSQVNRTQQTAAICNRRELARWEKPIQGKLKVNVDAAITQNSRCFSVGKLLRDHS